MNLERKSLWLALFASMAAMLMMPLFWPALRLFYFVPFLILTFYQKSFPVSLWWAFGCGLLVDLFSYSSRLGFTAIDYLLVTWILYKQRRHFFSDHFTTLPIMTFVFSCLATLIQIPLFYLFEGAASLSFSWFFTDLFIMPALDALYAFVIFLLLPLFCTQNLRKYRRA